MAEPKINREPLLTCAHGTTLGHSKKTSAIPTYGMALAVHADYFALIIL